jgi:hypothetical protein
MHEEVVLVTHFMSEDGETPLVSVPLSNIEKDVILFEGDFNELISRGLDPRWKLTSGLVYTRGEKKISIARLIVDAKKGDKVKHQDGNPLNLKRDNLVSAGGGGRETTNDRVKLPTKRLNFRLEHKYNKPAWLN